MSRGDDAFSVLAALGLVALIVIAATFMSSSGSEEEDGQGLTLVDEEDEGVDGDSGEEPDTDTGGQSGGGTGGPDIPTGEEPPEEPEPGPEPGPEPEPETPELVTQPPRSWTALFYVAYDNSIGPQEAWESDRYYLESVGSSEELNLVALVDQEFGGDCEVLFIQDGYSWSYSVSVIDPDWDDEVDTGDPDVLKGFLSWGMETFPADHVNLHIMDHGGAWSGVCIDETDGGFIESWEAGEVFGELKEEFGGNIDVVSIDACFMSSFEFAYEISDGVDYLNGLLTIATGDPGEDGRQLANWKYTEIYEGLRDNPGWTGEQFALHQLGNMYEIGPYIFPSMTQAHMQCTDAFGVSDLRQVGPLVEAFDSLAREMYDNITGPGSARAEEQFIAEIIGHAESPPEMNTESYHGQCELMGQNHFRLYDLGDFLDRLAEHGDALCSPETAKEARRLMDDVVVGCVHGDNAAIGEHPDATGLNVYITYRSANRLDEYAGLRLARETMWDELLAEVPLSS